MRFDTINGLPGLILSGPAGLIQTSAFEIEGDLVKAIGLSAFCLIVGIVAVRWAFGYARRAGSLAQY